MFQYEKLYRLAYKLALHYPGTPNLGGEGYVVDHLTLAAWMAGVTTVRLRILKATVEPVSVRTEGALRSPVDLQQWFKCRCEAEGIDLEPIRETNIRLAFQFPKPQWWRRRRFPREFGYNCEGEIVDDDGTPYCGSVRERWKYRSERYPARGYI